MADEEDEVEDLVLAVFFVAAVAIGLRRQRQRQHQQEERELARGGRRRRPYSAPYEYTRGFLFSLESIAPGRARVWLR
jgi:hypothetical protein